MHLTAISEEERKQTEYVLSQLLGETDRGAALVGGGMVDDALADLLLAVMNDTKGAKELIANGLAPLKPFSARQKLARQLGITTEREDADVQAIREIRNIAAHVIGTHVQPRTKLFTSADIAPKCQRLRFYDNLRPDFDPDPRDRFMMTVAALTFRFERLAALARREAIGRRLVVVVEDAVDRPHNQYADTTDPEGPDYGREPDDGV